MSSIFYENYITQQNNIIDIDQTINQLNDTSINTDTNDDNIINNNTSDNDYISSLYNLNTSNMYTYKY